MKKKILCLAMAAVMAVGIHTTAFAETLQGGSDWKVEFNGSKMSSNFTSADMKKDIFQLQPGDTMELQVGLKNTSEKDADWYMTNEVLKSLEDSQSIAADPVTVTTVTKKGEDKVVNKTVTKTVQTPTKNVVRSPKTGDTTQILAISAVALASGVILLILAVVLIKKRKEEKGEGQR